MSCKDPGFRWKRLFFRKVEVWKTTWKLRLAFLVSAALLISLFHGVLFDQISESLVCSRAGNGGDIAIIEDFDINYLLYEKAAELLHQGLVGKVYVPVSCNRSGSGPNSVYQGFIQVMTGYSRLEEYELIPITEIEPIRLNAARQVRDFLGEKEAIRSLVVVSPGFTSRRSFLVYREVFKGTGVEVSCLPVFGQRNTSNWTGSWHGIQEVFLELGKLWYYRLAVL